ncbi:MAG: hypothetical protein MJE77_29915 [Proteobacteria bacterium]|nr:hypothetical protein [Pseudomonadota bacterium]
MAIDRVALVDDTHATPSKAVTGSSLEPTAWVERIRAMLAPDELIKFEQMHRNMAPGDIHRRYGGDFDIALSRVKATTAKSRNSIDRAEASKRRATELRAIIEARGLMRDPQIKEIISKLERNLTNKQLKTTVEKVRSKLITEVTAAEAQSRYPGSRVHKDVEIWVEQLARTNAEFKLNHPNYVGGYKELPTSNGTRVHVLSTDIDILVVRPQPAGKARIVHREEIKSGAKEKPAKARRQLDKGLERLTEAASGEENIRLIEDGVDITDTIDLSTAPSSSGVARGPAGKRFEESLGISARDLEVLVKQLLESELGIRASEGN